MNLERLTWRFSLLGVPVAVHPFFWLLSVLFSHMWASRAPSVWELWLWTLLGAGFVFVGVLAHELGHALAGRRLGRSPRIQLLGMGGLTSWGGYSPPTTVWQAIWISFSGPLVGIVLGGAVWLLEVFVLGDLLAAAPATVNHLIFVWIFVNLGWAIFNLLPIVPLDGGHIMQAAATYRWRQRGTEGSFWVSLVLAVILAVASIPLGAIFTLVLFGYLAYMNWVSLKQAGAERFGEWWRRGRKQPAAPRKRRRSGPNLRVVKGGADDDEPPRWLN